MSNIDKAARIVRDLSEVDGETIGYAHAHNIAHALADEGLLMPELPEPWLHTPPDTFAWEAPENIIAKRDRGTVELGPYTWCTPTQARDLALALLAAAILAAANYSEEA